MSGDMARNTTKGFCENNPIAVTFDATSSDGNPAIVGFITSYAAAQWSTVMVMSQLIFNDIPKVEANPFTSRSD